MRVIKSGSWEHENIGGAYQSVRAKATVGSAIQQNLNQLHVTN